MRNQGFLSVNKKNPLVFVLV